MQSFWDLLPASLWLTQPFISPDEQARTMRALWALQAPGNSLSPASAGVTNLAGTSAWAAPSPASFASGGDDASTAGGILGAVLGSSARTQLATSFQNQPPPQAGPFVPPVSTADALDPPPPRATAPTAPQVSTGINAAPPARSMLPSPPSPDDPYGRAPPEGWFMRQLDRFDPPLASSIRNGSLWEPITAPAQSIGPNIRQPVNDSTQLLRDGGYETIHGNTFTGPARMALGALGYLYSPRAGAGKTLGEEATKWTGNPDFGRKVELFGPMLIPAGASALGRWLGPRLSGGADVAKPLDVARKADLADGAAPVDAARVLPAAPFGLAQARNLSFEDENKVILYDRNRKMLEENRSE
jgi:hypothetical protein